MQMIRVSTVRFRAFRPFGVAANNPNVTLKMNQSSDNGEYRYLNVSSGMIGEIDG